MDPPIRNDRVVLANGTTRLQLDITRSSCLNFHMLFSSELLGLTKESLFLLHNDSRTDFFRQPCPKIYHQALSLLCVQPSQSIMVAAHAYDLRAAKKVYDS